jgi:hypothetical protein
VPVTPDWGVPRRADLYAVYDPVESELLIGSAGHIPPVLVRAADGRSELLEIPPVRRSASATCPSRR